MKTINKLIKLFFQILLFVPLIGQADVFVEVTATMIPPTCNIRSEDNSSPLKVSFGTHNIDNLDTLVVNKDFPLYITGCDFSRELAVILNPKGYSTFIYNGRLILATSTEGLGVNINDVTGGTVRALEVNQIQRIYPEKIDTAEYRVDLQAQLVNTLPVNQLVAGPFTSTMMILVTYY